jgi:hypothetical protein
MFEKVNESHVIAILRSRSRLVQLCYSDDSNILLLACIPHKFLDQPATLRVAMRAGICERCRLPDSEVKNRARARRRARARSVGIVRRNKARISPHHFVLSA